MDKPPTLFEQIEQTYKTNCETIRKIEAASNEVNHICIEASAEGSVVDIKKRKIEKKDLLAKKKEIVFEPTPLLAPVLGVVAPNPSAPKEKPADTLDFAGIVVHNEHYFTLVHECKKVFNQETLEKFEKTSLENLCRLQPLLQDHFDAIHPFEIESTIEAAKSFFEQLGSGYSIELKRKESEPSDATRWLQPSEARSDSFRKKFFEEFVRTGVPQGVPPWHRH